MNITRKKINKKKFYGSKIKFNKNIRELKKKIKNINVNDIISIDEVGFDTNICSNYGWSKKGTKICKIINSSRKRYTAICAISNKKVISVKIIKNSSNAIIFLDFIKTNLKDINNKYLLLDNARIHHSIIVKEHYDVEKTSTNKFLFAT